MEFIFGKNLIMTLYRVFLIVLFFYVGFGMLMLFTQRNLIYHPTNAPLSQCDLSGIDAEYITIGSEQALYHQGTSNRIVVIYHGNADSACRWRDTILDFSYRGDSVLIPEWPGYAGDQRETNKETMFQMVDTVDRWVANQEYDQIYVVSFSIGGALASYQVSLGNTDRVLLYDNYDNLFLLQQVDTPIWIMHGENDQVVSPNRSLRLKDQLGNQIKQYILVPNKGHNDLLSENAYNTIIDQFLIESNDE